MGFVNLFQKPDKPWMNRKVGSMNLRLDRALMRYDMFHINVTGASYFVREDFMRHGLHLNSQSKRRLLRELLMVRCQAQAVSCNNTCYSLPFLA
jgi:hypothetical protein